MEMKSWRPTRRTFRLCPWQPRPSRGRTPQPQQIREVFFNAARDSKSGSIYLKVVNAAGSAQKIQVQIHGVAKVAPEGELVSLAANSPSDTNSLEQPQRIVPRKETALNLGVDFTREFPPYSITVLKLKTE